MAKAARHARIFSRTAKRFFTLRPSAAKKNARRTRLFERLCLGDLCRLRHLHRHARRQKHQEPDQLARLRCRGDRFARTARRSFSPPNATATSSFIRWTSNGKNVKRLTNELGYDGGAFYSPDSKQIVYRGSHPTTRSDHERTKTFLPAPDRADTFSRSG